MFEEGESWVRHSSQLVAMIRLKLTNLTVANNKEGFRTLLENSSMSAVVGEWEPETRPIPG